MPPPPPAAQLQPLRPQESSSLPGPLVPESQRQGWRDRKSAAKRAGLPPTRSGCASQPLHQQLRASSARPECFVPRSEGAGPPRHSTRASTTPCCNWTKGRVYVTLGNHFYREGQPQAAGTELLCISSHPSRQNTTFSNSWAAVTNPDSKHPTAYQRLTRARPPPAAGPLPGSRPGGVGDVGVTAHVSGFLGRAD